MRRLRGGLYANVVSQRGGDARSRDQFAVVTGDVVGLGADDSVLDQRGRGRDAEVAPLLRQGNARLRGGAPQRPGAELDRLARDGRTLVRRDGAVAEHHRDAPEGHVQLVGDNLRQRRADARAEIDMAAEGRHLAGRRDDDEVRASPLSRCPRPIREPRTGRQRGSPAFPDSPRERAPAAEAPSCAGQRRGKPHGGDDLDMRAAAAEIEAQRLADLGLGRHPD